MQLAKQMPCNYNIPFLNVPLSLQFTFKLTLFFCFNNDVNAAVSEQVVQHLKCKYNHLEKDKTQTARMYNTTYHTVVHFATNDHGQ